MRDNLCLLVIRETVPIMVITVVGGVTRTDNVKFGDYTGSSADINSRFRSVLQVELVYRLAQSRHAEIFASQRQLPPQ